jgi:homoserine kinase type II
MTDSIPATWLRVIGSNYPAAWQPKQIHPLSNRGHSASSVWKVQAMAGAAAVRCWAPWMTASRLSAIHHILATGRQRGLTGLPEMIETAGKATFCQVHGRLWEMSRWIPGVPADTGSLEENARRQIVEFLAGWHKTYTPESIGASLDALADESAVHAFRQSILGPCLALQRRKEVWSRLRGTMEIPIPVDGDPLDLSRRAQVVARRWAAWMDQLFQKEAPASRLALCIGDFHAGNVLLRDQQLAGVIDFEAVCLDSPARDVARLIGSLFPFDGSRWAEVIAWYDALMPLAPREKELIPLLDWSGAVIATLRWRQWLGRGEVDRDRRSAGYERWRLVVERLEHPGNEVLMTN